MRKVCAFVCLTLFFIPGVLLAPEPNKLFQVYVSVSSDDQKAFIESHIKRELRALHDVEIASWDTARYFLNIVALEGKYVNGMKTGGISISFCWYKRTPVPKDFRAKPPYSVPDEFYKNAWDHRDKHTSFNEPHLGVRHDSTEKLDDACKSIVARFDQSLLEPYRESLRKIQELKRE